MLKPQHWALSSFHRPLFLRRSAAPAEVVDAAHLPPYPDSDKNGEPLFRASARHGVRRYSRPYCMAAFQTFLSGRILNVR